MPHFEVIFLILAMFYLTKRQQVKVWFNARALDCETLDSEPYTAQKMKFSIEAFFSKCDQSCSF